MQRKQAKKKCEADHSTDDGNRLDSIIDRLTDTRSIYGKNLRALAAWYKETANTKGQYAARKSLETLQDGLEQRRARLKLSHKEKLSGPITFKFGPRESAEKYARIGISDASGQKVRWMYPVKVLYRGKGYRDFEDVGSLRFSKQHRYAAPEIQQALGSDDFAAWLKLSEQERRARHEEEREERKAKQRMQVTRQEAISDDVRKALSRAGIDINVLDSLDAFVAHAPLLRHGKQKLSVLSYILDPKNKGGVERRIRSALEDENTPPVGDEQTQTALEHYATPGYKPEAWEIAIGRAWYYQHGLHLKEGLIGAFADDLRWIDKNSAVYTNFCNANPNTSFDCSLDKSFVPAKAHAATASTEAISVRVFLSKAVTMCTIAEAVGFERVYSGLTRFRIEYGMHLLRRFFGSADELRSAYDLLAEFHEEDAKRRSKTASDESVELDTLLGETLGGKVKDFIDFGKSSEKSLEHNLGYNYRIEDQLTMFSQLAILSRKLAIIKRLRNPAHSFVPDGEVQVSPPSVVEHGLIQKKYSLLTEYIRGTAPVVCRALGIKLLPDSAADCRAAINQALGALMNAYIPNCKSLSSQERRNFKRAELVPKSADTLQKRLGTLFGDTTDGLVSPEYTRGQAPLLLRYLRLSVNYLPVRSDVQDSIHALAFLENNDLLIADYHYSNEVGAAFSARPLVGKKYLSQEQLETVQELADHLSKNPDSTHTSRGGILQLVLTSDDRKKVVSAVTYVRGLVATYGKPGRHSHYSNVGSNLMPKFDRSRGTARVEHYLTHSRPSYADVHQILEDAARLRPFRELTAADINLVEAIARARLQLPVLSLQEFVGQLCRNTSDPASQFFYEVLKTKEGVRDRIFVDEALRKALNDEYESRCLDAHE